jgi:AraC-like DNA-binding protein
VGVTFARRLRELRLERAKQLLSRSDLNLTRIAELSGLSSAHYLCRVFKRATGETPQRFRMKIDQLFTVGKTVGKQVRVSGELTIAEHQRAASSEAPWKAR